METGAAAWRSRWTMDLTAIDNRLDSKTTACRVIVETPKGGRGKLAYDPETGAFELIRMLPDGMSFPLDFGFVPGTLGEDGDPLDVLVLNDEPSPVGALLTVRLLGVIEAEQTEDGKTIRNDRLLAVAQVSHLFQRVATPDDLGKPFLENLTQFWVNYAAQRGVVFKVLGVRGKAQAAKLIRDAATA